MKSNHVWNESIASHGTQEIASGLYQHFIKHIPKETRKIVLFSDITKKKQKHENVINVETVS